MIDRCRAARWLSGAAALLAIIVGTFGCDDDGTSSGLVDSGNLVGVVYNHTIDGQSAAVDTVVGPVVDETTVVAPV